MSRRDFLVAQSLGESGEDGSSHEILACFFLEHVAIQDGDVFAAHNERLVLNGRVPESVDHARMRYRDHRLANGDERIIRVGLGETDRRREDGEGEEAQRVNRKKGLAPYSGVGRSPDRSQTSARTVVQTQILNVHR